MEISIDGGRIKTEKDFHKAFSSALEIGPYYGENLHALWDVLSAGVERPLTLIWRKSSDSKKWLGKDFDAIVDVLHRVEIQDQKFELKERFLFILE